MSGIPRIKVSNYATFYYQYEFSLLDSLEAQGIPILHNCRGGYCGTCKVKLLDGQVHFVQDPLIETRGSEILACCCKPATHIEIELFE